MHPGENKETQTSSRGTNLYTRLKAYVFPRRRDNEQDVSERQPGTSPKNVKSVVKEERKIKIEWMLRQRNNSSRLTELCFKEGRDSFIREGIWKGSIHVRLAPMAIPVCGRG